MVVVENVGDWSPALGLGSQECMGGGKTGSLVKGSLRHGASSAWVGLVIRDSSRRCLEVKRMKVLASSAAMAESLVVLEGCLLAKGLNFPRVVIESDSNWLLRLFFELRLGTLPNLRLYLAFQACSWSFIPRSANCAADFVAKNFTSEMCNFVWAYRPTSSLVRILNKDGLPCPPSS
ncbi:hypothetical protein DVH24_007952 [Malus domestica]|uniref:RNase H type-1 domain-containing protein n=1 Tax=Malus domestica TaxID=3750 RepID=A0A498JPD1_MALDO|nr:hypothetical protein DVH24_007952 [Malus domestica]